MNAVFSIILILSAAHIALNSPDKLLPTLLSGSKNALSTAVTLFSIYAVWISFSILAERSGLAKSVARTMRPAIKKLFKTYDGEAQELIALNLSCNLLGLGGAATPYAVKAISRLEKSRGDFAQNLLFIVNATSIQLLPTTAITLRAAAGSSSPSDIVLPSLVATTFSTATAVAAFCLYFFIANRKKKKDGHKWHT